MKRLIPGISIFILLSLGTTANSAVESASPIKTVEATKDQILRNRLKELKSVNKSTLTLRERKELRQEVRQVRGQLDEPGGGGGLWISLAPLLVVILIIILL